MIANKGWNSYNTSITCACRVYVPYVVCVYRQGSVSINIIKANNQFLYSSYTFQNKVSCLHNHLYILSTIIYNNVQYLIWALVPIATKRYYREIPLEPLWHYTWNTVNIRTQVHKYINTFAIMYSKFRYLSQLELK